MSIFFWKFKKNSYTLSYRLETWLKIVEGLGNTMVEGNVWDSA